jgi:hypothetical protein
VDLPTKQIQFNGASGGWGAVGGLGAAPSNLSDGKTYYVRVAAFYDSGKKLAYSRTAAFTIQTVSQSLFVTIGSPSNNATVSSKPKITWSASGRIDAYRVDISQNSQFGSFWKYAASASAREITYSGAKGGWGNVGGAGSAPDDLATGETYYVRLVAFYQGQEVKVSPVVTIKVQNNTNLDHSNNGWIDAVTKQPNGSFKVSGWACAKNHPKSIPIDLYVGGPYGTGKGLGRFNAGLASEPAVASQCQSTGSSYRFAVSISASRAKTYGGLAIWIHGINPFDPSGMMNTVLPNSGKLKLPNNGLDHSNNGWIDSMSQKTDGSYMIYGWACAKSFTESIPVDVYFGGPYGTGTPHGRYMANQKSESAVAKLCKSTGRKYRFAVPVPAAIARANKGKKIFIHGINPYDPSGRMNTILPNSGVVLIP